MLAAQNLPFYAYAMSLCVLVCVRTLAQGERGRVELHVHLDGSIDIPYLYRVCNPTHLNLLCCASFPLRKWGTVGVLCPSPVYHVAHVIS